MQKCNTGPVQAFLEILLCHFFGNVNYLAWPCTAHLASAGFVGIGHCGLRSDHADLEKLYLFSVPKIFASFLHIESGINYRVFIIQLGKDGIMKYLIKNMAQKFRIACVLFWLAGLSGFFVPTPAICENSVADELISLNATGRPLGEILEDISIAANCQFSIDESWQDFPVTASFDNEPLYRGLKLILRDINTAVIYGADRTIKIIVYDENTSSGQAIGRPVTGTSAQEPIQPLQLSNEATAPQAEVEVSDDTSDAENAEQQPEETAESDSESNEANDDNPVAEEKEPGQESEESESASDSSETAETTESSTETSEN
jgi:hypothetical protein